MYELVVLLALYVCYRKLLKNLIIASSLIIMYCTIIVLSLFQVKHTLTIIRLHLLRFLGPLDLGFEPIFRPRLVALVYPVFQMNYGGQM